MTRRTSQSAIRALISALGSPRSSPDTEPVGHAEIGGSRNGRLLCRGPGWAGLAHSAAAAGPTTTGVIRPRRRARGGSRLRCGCCPVGSSGRPHTGNSKGMTLGLPGSTGVRWHTRGPRRAPTGGCMATTWIAHSRTWGRGRLRTGPVAAMFRRGAGRRRPLQTLHASLKLEPTNGPILPPAMSGMQRGFLCYPPRARRRHPRARRAGLGVVDHLLLRHPRRPSGAPEQPPTVGKPRARRRRHRGARPR